MSNLADLGVTLESDRGDNRITTIRRVTPQGGESSDGTVGSDGADSIPDGVLDATDAEVATFGVQPAPPTFPAVTRPQRATPGVITSPDQNERGMESGEL